MKKLLPILVIALLVFTTGFIKLSKETTKSEKYIAEKEKSSKRKKIKNKVNASKETREETYAGESLDVIERVGITKIHREASRSSRVLKELDNYEKVEILEIVPYGWFKVKLSDGTTGYAESVRIRTDKAPPYNIDKIDSEYILKFNQKKQNFKIYRGKEKIVDSKSSGGIKDEFTPMGVFKVNKDISGTWDFAQRFQQGYKYWTSFYDAAYLMHSIPFAQDKTVIKEEARKLGKAASHGCIRLPLPVAKYIYDELPDGSVLIIE